MANLPSDLARKLVEGFLEHLTDSDEKTARVLLKTVPIRKEWRDNLRKMREARKEVDGMMETIQKKLLEHDAYKKAFWSQVRIDLGVYNNYLEIVSDDSEIEISEDKKKDEE